MIRQAVQSPPPPPPPGGQPPVAPPPPPPMMPPGGGAMAVPGDLASPGLRVVGGLIDFIILLVINGIIAPILQKANWLAGIINFVADLAYFRHFLSSRGQSVGVMVFGVQVRELG